MGRKWFKNWLAEEELYVMMRKTKRAQ